MINKNETVKNIIKGVSAVAIYFIVSIYQTVPLTLMHIDLTSMPPLAKIIYSLATEISIITIIFLIFEKEIINAIKDLKQNHLEYFKKYFKYYLLGIIVMIVCNILISWIGGGISENEASIRDEFQKFPVYIFISSVFLAPVLEEFVFRLGFRAIFKNNIVYILTSSLLFGYLHLMGMPINKLFPLYLLSYSSSGIAFAYIMSKTNNIFVSTGFHFMHNGLLMAIQTFLLIFG